MLGVAVRFLLPIVVTLSIALAGCQDIMDGGGNVDLGAPLDNAGAKSLLADAAKASNTGKRGMTMTMVKNGAELMQMKTANDPAAGTAFMFMKGDPAVFDDGNNNGNSGGSSAGAYRFGITMYQTKTGTAWHLNKTVYAMPNGSNQQGNQGPSDDMGAFDPQDIGDLPNATVKSVKLVVHNGKAAAEIAITTKNDENQTIDLTVTVYRSPARIAKMTGVHPGDPDKANDPSKGANVTVDFTYDGEVTITPPEAVSRAINLAYKSQDSFTGGSPKKTWTFANSGGIPLSEVEVHVKQAPANSDDDNMPEPDKLTTLWTLKLADKTKTQGGVTVTFTDVDNDGKLSKNDKLEISSTGNEQPMVFLFDTKTQTYVVPSAALALALLAFAGVALLRRRS